MLMNRREFLFDSTACMLFPCFGKTSSNEFSSKIKPNYYTAVHEIIECRRDIVYFAEKYIKLPYGKQLVLKDWQKKYLIHLASGKDAVLDAYRQSRKTTTNLIYALWKTMFKPYQKITFVTCNKCMSESIFDVVETMYDDLPDWMKSRDYANEYYMHNAKHIMLKNGSELVVTHANADFCGYYPGNAIILDEFAYYSDKGTQNILDLMPVASSNNSQLIIASTPNTINDAFSNMFYKLRDANDDGLFVVLSA